jgi:hypothetical protein
MVFALVENLDNVAVVRSIVDLEDIRARRQDLSAHARNLEGRVEGDRALSVQVAGLCARRQEQNDGKQACCNCECSELFHILFLSLISVKLVVGFRPECVREPASGRLLSRPLAEIYRVLHRLLGSNPEHCVGRTLLQDSHHYDHTACQDKAELICSPLLQPQAEGSSANSRHGIEAKNKLRVKLLRANFQRGHVAFAREANPCVHS